MVLTPGRRHRAACYLLTGGAISGFYSGEEGIVLKLFGFGLLDPDGVHAHYREDCPRVRRLHPGELRVGLTAIRSHCPCCSDIAARKKSRISQD
jgi:hypothetical protein